MPDVPVPQIQKGASTGMEKSPRCPGNVRELLVREGSYCSVMTNREDIHNEKLNGTLRSCPVSCHLSIPLDIFFYTRGLLEGDKSSVAISSCQCMIQIRFL